MGNWRDTEHTLYDIYEKDMHISTRIEKTNIKVDRTGHTPSKGFKRAMSVIESGLCTRVIQVSVSVLVLILGMACLSAAARIVLECSFDALGALHVSSGDDKVPRPELVHL